MPKPRPRRSAAEREVRRIRIVAAIRNGRSYDRIARAEKISPERVRQIVVETMRRSDEVERDLSLVEAARLEPALRRTLQSVAAGRLEAVDRLLKILDRVDKYRARARTGACEPDSRERLIATLERTAGKPDLPEIPATRRLHPPAPPSQPLERKENDDGISWTSADFAPIEATLPITPAAAILSLTPPTPHTPAR